jgi:hypothetical protein
LEEVIKSFEEEIRQYNIMLGGIMNAEYRTYIETKVSHYELAIFAMKESLNRRKQEYYRRLTTHDN